LALTLEVAMWHELAPVRLLGLQEGQLALATVASVGARVSRIPPMSCPCMMRLMLTMLLVRLVHSLGQVMV